jgi:uncharacterized protein YfaS (alpha-2-macroglobulin family)
MFNEITQAFENKMNCKFYLKPFPFFVLAFFLCFGCTFSSAFASEEQYKELWQQIDAAIDSGKVETARGLAFSIFQDAQQKNNQPQRMKSLITIAGLSAYKSEKGEAEISEILQREYNAATNIAEKSILASLLAEALATYYEHYASDIDQRSNVQSMQDTLLSIAFKYWDKQIFRQKIREYLDLSLRQADSLRTISVRTWAAILRMEPMSELFRPTLLDLLAYRALEILENIERRHFGPDKAEFTDIRVLLPIAQFLADSSQSYGSENSGNDAQGILMQMRIYRLLLQIHPENSEASIHADTKRLLAAHALLFHPAADSLIRSALLRTARSAQHVQACAMAYYEAALLYYNQENYAQAMSITSEALKRYPESLASIRCAELQDMMRDKSLSISLQQTLLPGQPFQFSVQYRNIDRIFCKVLRLQDIEKNQARKRYYRDYYFDSESLGRIREIPSIIAWKQELPKANDYKTHITTKRGPRLPAGQYLLLISPDGSFSLSGDNAIAYTPITVSNLSILHQNIPHSGNSRVIITDAQKGRPIQGATVQVFNQVYNRVANEYDKKLSQALLTDQNGMVEFRAGQEGALLQIIYGTDTLRPENQFQNYKKEEIPEQPRISLFTDRAVYRPGQNISFKGIIYRKNKPDEAQVTVQQKIRIALLDQSGNELATQELTSNDYGSVTGSFTLPLSLLPGTFSLSSSNGSTFFQVEEYKRPGFEALFDTQKDAAIPGRQITISGSARTYAGAPVASARIQYRVMRTVAYPYWCWKWLPIPMQSNKEIAHGRAQTKADGTFTLEFLAQPDPGTNPAQMPVFTYKVIADITEPSGETRSISTDIQAGYARAYYTIDAAPLQSGATAATCTVHAYRPGGAPAGGMKGRLIIEKLQTPEQPLHRKFLPQQDMEGISEKEYKDLFPGYIWQNEDEPGTWKAIQIMASMDIQTDSAGHSPMNIGSLSPGVYRLRFIPADSPESFDTNTVLSHITVYAQDMAMPWQASEVFDAGKTTVEPGQKTNILWGTAWPDAWLLVQTEHKGRIISQNWLSAGQDIKKIEIPVTEQMRGGFTVHLAMTRAHMLYKHSIYIDVPWTNKMLKVQTLTFRDKTGPGSQQKWSLQIKPYQDNKQPIPATELMIRLYDASLDAISPASLPQIDLWDNYPTECEPMGITDGIKYSMFASGTAWNLHPGSQNMLPEFDKINTEILKGGLFGRTEIIYMQDNMSAGGLRRDTRMNWKGTGSGRLNRRAMAMAAAPAQGLATQQKNTMDEAQDGNAETQAIESAGPLLRRNKQETALFLPALRTDAKGIAEFSFTMPEALTRWNLMAFAHTKDMRTGNLQASTITFRTIMIQPNLPRFLYQGDTISLSTTVYNTGNLAISTGKARITVLDADSRTIIYTQNKDFSCAAQGSAAISWTYIVSDTLRAVNIRIEATDGSDGDGEEITIPILPRRRLIMSTYPIWLRPGFNENKQNIEIKELKNTKNSTPLSLTLQIATQPGWYAVQALPNLLAKTDQSTLGHLYRFYAALLGRTLIKDNPGIAAMLQSGRIKGQLQQNLEQNPLLQETPWMARAKEEIQSIAGLSIYANPQALEDIAREAFTALQNMQAANGGFAWFPGMMESRHITQQVMIMAGQLSLLKAIPDTYTAPLGRMMRKAAEYTDAEFESQLRRKENNDKGMLRLSSQDIEYAYARSLFIRQYPLPATAFTDSLKKLVFEQRMQFGVQCQSMAALFLHNIGKTAQAQSIMNALRERALQSNSEGIYWKSSGWDWQDAPVETHVILLHAFRTISPDPETEQGILTYLLRLKQNTAWPSNSATAAACAALLQQQKQCLENQQNPVIVQAGNNSLPTFPTEFPGTLQAGIKGIPQAQQADISIQSSGTCPAWGSVQYTSWNDLDANPASVQEDQLSISRIMYTELPGGQLIPINNSTQIQIGQRIIVQLRITSSRTIDYVQIQDLRAAGLEPVDVISGYKIRNTAAWYQAIHDSWTGFYLENLPKGITTIEYTLRASGAGSFSNGYAGISSIYAPESAAHTAGNRIIIMPLAK